MYLYCAMNEWVVIERLGEETEPTADSFKRGLAQAIARYDIEGRTTFKIHIGRTHQYIFVNDILKLAIGTEPPGPMEILELTAMLASARPIDAKDTT